MKQEITDRRSEAADEAVESYDLEGMTVVGTSGWEHETPGTQITRTFFVQDPEHPEGDSLKAHFNVDFADASSDVVVSAEAYVGDVLVGRMTPRTPTI